MGAVMVEGMEGSGYADGSWGVLAWGAQDGVGGRACRVVEPSTVRSCRSAR